MTKIVGYFDQVKRIDSLEITLDAKVGIACGGSDSKGLLVAFSFDGHFDYINKLEFDDSISRVKRLAKSDVFLVGGWKTLYFTQYSNKKMTKLSSIADISPGLITWIEVCNHQVFTLDQSGTDLRKITFQKDLENYEPKEKTIS